MFDYVFSEYNRGYLKALLDMKELFERSNKKMMAVSPKGKKKNLYSQEGIIALLQFLIENTDDFRENGDMFVFWYGCDEKGKFLFHLDDGTLIPQWEREGSKAFESFEKRLMKYLLSEGE